MKHSTRHILLLWLALITSAQVWADSTVTTLQPTDITETKAMLQATFADGITTNGFQYKYGTIPERTDFVKLAIAPTGDPLSFTQGDKAWRARTAVGCIESYYDTSASTLTSDLSTTFTLTEATTISFDWRVSSEENIGTLNFLVDGISVQSITGETDFTTVSHALTAGEHTIIWRYNRTAAENAGLGLGYLKNINIQNTTAGEWLSANADSGSLQLANLYPGQQYLFRAFSTIDGEKVYSDIKQFETNAVSIGKPEVTDTTQATATVKCPVNSGDAEVETGFIIKHANPVTLDAFANAILSADSDPITFTHDSQWMTGDGFVYMSTSVDNKYVTTSPFTLSQATTITFKWAVRGLSGSSSSRLRFYVDGYQDSYISATSNTSYTIYTKTVTLSAGTHTLSWSSYYFGSYYARISDLCIKNTGNITSTIPNDTIPVTLSNGELNYTITGLRPNRKHEIMVYMKPIYNSPLEKKWDVEQSESAIFTTKPLIADTLAVINKKQASVTLRGIADGGDANIVAKGLQYRVSTGQRWTNATITTNQDTIIGNVRNLRPSTEYQYRAFIQAQDCDTVFSNIATFSTEAVIAKMPIVAERTQHTAKVQGEVVYGDAVIYTRGMMFRKAGADAWEDIEDVGAEEVISLSKTGLDINSSYQARTYIQPAGCDTIYSNVYTFRTKNIEIFTDSVSNVCQRSVTIHGRVLVGDDSASGIKISVYALNGYLLGEEIESFPIASTDSNISAMVNNLKPNTKYAFMIEAVNSKGETVKSQNVTSAFTNDEFTRALLSPSSSKNIVVTSKTDWKANTDEGYVYATNYVRNVEKSLSVRVTLTKSATISFDWMYYSPTYHSYYFKVDGESTKSHASSYSQTVTSETCELTAGTHTLSWYEYWGDENDSDFRVMNLYIPEDCVEDDYRQFSTSKYYVGEYSSIVSNERATVKCRINSTTDNNVIYKLKVQSDDDYIRAIYPEEKYQESINGVIVVGQVSDSIVTFQIEDLCPGVSYHYNAITEIDDETYDEGWIRYFWTKGYVPDGEGGMWFDMSKVSDITQTSAKLETELYKQADYPITEAGYKYWLKEGSDTLSVIAQTTDSLMTATLTGLLPGKTYYHAYYVKVNGVTYYPRDFVFKRSLSGFTTVPVGLNITMQETTQTGAVAKVTVDQGQVTITDLKCFVNQTEFAISSDGTVNVTGLVPGRSYNLMLTYIVEGESYTYNFPFETKPVTISASIAETAQTAIKLNVPIDLGTATLIEMGALVNQKKLLFSNINNLVVNNLIPGTKYYLIPFVRTEEGGYVYASEINVTTKPITLTTGEPTNISNRSATLNGTIDCDEYSNAEFGFQWKEKTGWTTDPRFTKGRKNDDGSITISLVNGMLKPDTEYEYRTAVRYQGQYYVADTWDDLRTELEYVYYAATVYTLYRTDSENNRLVLCGYYVAGSESVVSQGYQYWQNTANAPLHRAPGDVQTVVTDSTMVGEIDLATLDEGYYSLRAFVQTSSGTIYGNVLPFTVGNPAPTGISGIRQEGIICLSGKQSVDIVNAEGHSAEVYTVGGQLVTTATCTDNITKVSVNTGIYLIRIDNGQMFKIAVGK